MKLFRVEKDGISFHVQGEDAENFFTEGYKVFVHDVGSDEETRVESIDYLRREVEINIKNSTHTLKLGG